MLRSVLCLLCLVPVAASASSVDEQIKEVEREYCSMIASIAMQAMADRQLRLGRAEEMLSEFGDDAVIVDILKKAAEADVLPSEEERLLTINGFGGETYRDCVANPDKYFK